MPESMLLVDTRFGVGFGIATCGETMKLNAMKRQGRHDDEEASLLPGGQLRSIICRASSQPRLLTRK
jgi:hypothetical protein